MRKRETDQFCLQNEQCVYTLERMLIGPVFT